MDTGGQLSAENSVRFTPPLGGERNRKTESKKILSEEFRGLMLSIS